MRIGIFGGTFDPIHESHVEMGLDAVRELSLDKLFYVPTRPWQKTARACEEDRLRMLETALEPYRDQLVADTRELTRGGPSYSIDTLYSFRREYGEQTPIFFVMGSDQWKNLTTWILWQKFPLLANLFVVTRDGSLGENPYGDKFPIVPPSDAACSEEPSGSICVAKFEPAAYSSTQIRRALANVMTRDRPIPGLSAQIHQYILEHGLYRAEN